MPPSELIDRLNVSGVWWLPERPDRRVPGELILAGGDFELRLDGQLFAPELREGETIGVRPEWKTLPTVHGRSREDTPITLLECEGYVLPIPEGPGFGGRETYTPQVALVGSHLDETRAFQSASVEFDVLAPWVDPPSVLDERGGKLDEARFAERKRVLESAELPGLTAEVVVWSVGNVGDSSVHLDQVVTLDLSFQEPCTWRDTLQQSIRPFTDLLALMTVHPVRLTAVTLRPASSESYEPSLTMHLPLVQAPASDPPRSPSIPQQRMLSCRVRPLLTFENLVPRWFELHERLGGSIGMLTLPLRTPFLYDENRFLTAFWSAESLHGAVFDPRQLSEKAHETRVAAILDPARESSVDAEVLGWAAAILTNRNDKPLRQRVEELLERSGAVGRRIVRAQPKFVGNLTGTRGPLSHSGAGGKLKSPDRYFHGEALRWVVRTCILLELGAAPEQVERVVIAHEQFTWVIRHLAGGPT